MGPSADQLQASLRTTFFVRLGKQNNFSKRDVGLMHAFNNIIRQFDGGLQISTCVFLKTASNCEINQLYIKMVDKNIYLLQGHHFLFIFYLVVGPDQVYRGLRNDADFQESCYAYRSTV